MKKSLLLLLMLSISLSTVACSSGEVVDYTGKDYSEEKGDASDSEDSENKKAEKAEKAESGKAAETSYNENIIKFNVHTTQYIEGYFCDAIVEIENTGKSNIYISNPAFDIEDANNSLLMSEDYVNVCPEVIMPGEKGYMYTTMGLEGISDIEGIHLKPQYIIKAVDATPTKYEVSDTSIKEGEYGVSVVGRVTNSTEVDNDYIYIQVIYYDAEGNVLGLTGTSITDLLAGRTVSFDISGIDLPEDVTMDKVADFKIIAEESLYLY